MKAINGRCNFGKKKYTGVRKKNLYDGERNGLKRSRAKKIEEIEYWTKSNGNGLR